MKQCKKCGLSLPDEAEFCIRCGNPIEAPAAAVAPEKIDAARESASFSPQGGNDFVSSNVPPQRSAGNTTPKSDGHVPPPQWESVREDMIRQYLNRVKEKEAAQIKQEKEDILKKIGLTSRVYSAIKRFPYENPDFIQQAPQYSNEFPTFDPQRQQWYKAVPIEVSDEEWAEILEAYQTDQDLKKEKSAEVQSDSANSIAAALKVIGYVMYAAALILGFVLGASGGSIGRSFSLTSMLICWFAGFIAGTMMLGFGEIIRLLQAIRNNP